MPKIRPFLFILAAALIVLAIISENWIAPASRSHGKIGSLNANRPAIPASYEENAFLFQIKATAGIWHMLEQQNDSNPQYQALILQAQNSIRQSLDMSLGRDLSAGNPSRVLSFKLLAGQLISSYYFNAAEAKFRLCSALKDEKAEMQEFASQTKALLARLCLPEICSSTESSAASCSPYFSPAEQNELHNQMGWFGDLLSYSTASSPVEKTRLSRAVFESARATLSKALKAGFFAILLGFISFCSFTFALFKIASGKIEFQYRDEGMPAEYSLELFTIYLALMFLIPKFLDFLSGRGVDINPLRANTAGIMLTLLVLLWPLLMGQKLMELRVRLGLRLISLKRTLADIALGPFAYFSFLSFLLIVLIAYAFILLLLGVDPAKSAHPIIPLISETQDPWVILTLTVLAVIIAPVIEEIMFRGALYSWLRQYLSAVPAMLLSGLAFASLHPQGAIGILPLTCIGFLLAFLREWRGNLTSCIFAHACVNGLTLALVFALFR